jgi:4'-phosphopantetheinyl transferase
MLRADSSAADREVVQASVAETAVFAADRARVTQALAWMTPDERARFDRFRHDQDRMMFALGRAMARTLVGRTLGIAPGAWRWREGPHGRPEIDSPATDLHFNLSHSAGLVVCALARGRSVGVDVEHLDRRAPDRAIVPRYCAPAEAADVEARGEAWPARFLQYWTLKEAYLKARGLGIAVHLSDIAFTLDAPGGIRVAFERSLAGTDDRWAFTLTQPTPAHLLALAVPTDDGARPAFRVQPFEPLET